MSTRSVKRINNSIHDQISNQDSEQVVDSTRKTRSRRMKENVDESTICLLRNAKRTNYVSYPAEVEMGSDAMDCEDVPKKPIRLLRKNTLKELNLITPLKSDNLTADIKRSVRITRSTQKFAEETAVGIEKKQKSFEDVSREDIQQLRKKNHPEEVNIKDLQKSQKMKKKKQFDKGAEGVISKKKSKKKKRNASSSSSIIVEDIEPETAQKMSLNNSHMSSGSFHSAAGSQLIEENILEDEMYNSPQKLEVLNSSNKNNIASHTEKTKRLRQQSRSRSRHSNTSITPKATIIESRKRKSCVKDHDGDTEKSSISIKSLKPHNNSLNRKKKLKSSIKDAVIEENNVNTTFDKENENFSFDLNKKKKSINNSTIDKSESFNAINSTNEKIDKVESIKSTYNDSTCDKNTVSYEQHTTFDKETTSVGSAKKNEASKFIINTTLDKSINTSLTNFNTNICDQRKSIIIDTTFEKDAENNQELLAKRSSMKNTTYDKDISLQNDYEANGRSSIKETRLSVPSQIILQELDNTYDKLDKSDSTFDKDKKINITFDKTPKTSLISSDNSNITIDKCDMSRISITSDDSSQNINMTPVLIESSLDESQVASKLSPQPTHTLLKREGTFTKDSEVADPPLASITPTKLMSLPFPGYTPYHVNKSSSKEKSVLNITQSIEKIESRRSSLAETLPRTTKVMFCSPVNNPAVVLQQRRKVIKSNLKGSNKSFVLEETAAPETRAAPRKRSYTQSDADAAGVKRKRLADGLQHSVGRLSRPRTTSASAKFPERGTPSKKLLTPKKSETKVLRTKLPNFAALHQKQFDKMESLGECQERKAKRAKQLLTPTGALTVLDRSPRENTTEPAKSPTDDQEKEKKEKHQKNGKQSQEPPKKPDTPVKSLPTLKSLNPGYTRFGFKLNLDVNPFNIAKKPDATNDIMFDFSARKDCKAKTSLFSFSSKRDHTKPLTDIRRGLKREATVPSLVGTTSARKEVAKQTIMREKSYADRRNLNRTIIKGVRTNRRFELQMRMRNLD